MKIFALIIISGLTAFSQNINSIRDSILNESLILYKSEKASWNATDYVEEHLSNISPQIGGYLSYASGNDEVCTIFFSRKDSSKVLSRLKYTGVAGKIPNKVESEETEASALELSLIKLRQEAVWIVNSDNDHFFSFYEKSEFNFIPIKDKYGDRVFILTGTQNNDEVIFGNDYLLYFNNDLSLLKKEKLHSSIIRTPSKSPEGNVEAVFHSHILNEFITSTDICTMLLYKDFNQWKSIYVMGKNYTSIFDLKNNDLVIMKNDDFMKIYKKSDNLDN
jgi:hypothetical protein